MARRFLVVYFVLLTVASIAMGVWVGQEVETSIVNRTAAVTALYIESFIDPHLQSLSTQATLDAPDATALKELLAGTQLGQDIVSFKVWSPDGTIVFSPAAELVGRHFTPDRDLALSLAGEITADVTTLGDEENGYERQHWTRLLQTYVPIRVAGGADILGVAEFYQLPDAVDAEVASSRLRAWEIVLVAALGSYVLVALVVGRAGTTIAHQQQRLRDKVDEVSGLFHQVADLNSRLNVAAGQTIEVATKEQRRIGADLHDGPAQAMALALLRLESFQDSADVAGHDDTRVTAAYSAVSDAMTEIRQIAAGLQLPDLGPMPVADVIRRAVDDHRRRSGATVERDMGELLTDAPLPIKIALFRGLQEALSNSTRHGRAVGMSVRAREEDGALHVEVRDEGPGFDVAAAQGPGLGLPGMRERVALLGGEVVIQSALGHGTTVHMSLPVRGNRGEDERRDAGSPEPGEESRS